MSTDSRKRFSSPVSRCERRVLWDWGSVDGEGSKSWISEMWPRTRERPKGGC